MLWDIIINPFVTILTFLYSLFGQNVVLAIIVFTILIRVAILPLTAQQQRSAKEMQKLQPKLKELQEKHKNDREKLAQEQMALYREHGVNPFGGCLPLLIQLPILIALYQAIIFALAATPFQLVDLAGRMPAFLNLDRFIPLNNIWLGMDLTKPPTANPTWALILPALVLVTTWLQSKVTIPPPSTSPRTDGKPDQAQMMQQQMTTIMPLMFGFFSLSFSVGLSIYFITGNIIGIIQYSLMNDNSQLRKWLGRGKTDEAVEVDVKPRAINTQKTKNTEQPQPEKTKTKKVKSKAGGSN
jgi:YidC/Oxa1 family membrane protein insertase